MGARLVGVDVGIEDGGRPLRADAHRVTVRVQLVQEAGATLPGAWAEDSLLIEVDNETDTDEQQFKNQEPSSQVKSIQ